MNISSFRETLFRFAAFDGTFSILIEDCITIGNKSQAKSENIPFSRKTNNFLAVLLNESKTANYYVYKLYVQNIIFIFRDEK